MITATLASGRPHGDLSLCGAALIPAVAEAIGSAPRRSVDERQWFGTVYQYGARLRDSRILQSALRVAADRSASTAARTTALMIAIAQLQPGNFPAGYASLESLIDRGVPAICGWSSITDSQYWADEGLPADALARVRATARQMAAEHGRVQRLGRCAELLLSSFVVASLQDASSITVTAVCDRLFRVYNPTDTELDLHWSVAGTDETGEMAIGAGSKRILGTDERGTLVVSWNGSEIARIENVQRACTP